MAAATIPGAGECGPIGLPGKATAGQRIIGLTGLYCAGKNHVASLLERRGARVLDLDTLGHKAHDTKQDDVVNTFGGEVLCPHGGIDRQALGLAGFGNAGRLSSLEAIVHPEVDRLTGLWLAENAAHPVIINAAVLHNSACFKRLSAIIMVTAPLPLRLLRAKKRDRLPWPDLFKRMTSQRSFFTQYLAGNTDTYSIYNGRSSHAGQKSLEEAIDRLLERLGISSF
jgi:dephospho-CoA kinase